MRPGVKRGVVAVLLAGAALGGGAYAAAGDTTPEGQPPSTVEDTDFVQIPGAAVGRVDDSEMFIAVLVENGTIRVYSCNGTVDQGTVDSWFEGPWDGSGPVTLTNGTLRVTVAAEGEAFVGQIHTVDDHVFTFRAEMPTTDTAGLYRTPRTNPDTGEVIFRHGIILDDGDIRGTFAPVVTRCRYVVKKRYDVVTGQQIEYVVQICG
jgi:hypothetical protein